ncbi:hypothetical protein D3C75_381980 [compost metagenome]
MAGALVHGVDDLLLVDGHVHGLAHFQLRHRVWLVVALDLVHHVVGDVAQVEPGLLRHLQGLVFLERLQVGRTREQGDLALVLLQLLDAYRRVGGDGEDQVVDLDVVRLPVVLVPCVADVGVFLVALEHERAGADRLLVDVGCLAFLEQLGSVLGGLDRGEAHGHVLDERGINVLEGELDSFVVDFIDLGDVGVHPHVGEVREFGRVRFAERIILVNHAIKGEQHVVGVELTSRFEIRGSVELDAFTQVEGVGQAVIGNVPLGRQPRNHGGAATFELGEAVEHGFCRGVEVGSGGVLTWIETGRAPFGAEHQVSRCLGERCAG